MDKFDVIVVGAGLAGLGCAYTLAGSGLEVLVLERGEYPGAKNVTGGRLYVNPVRDLFPDLWAEAPVERPVVREGITLLAAGRSVDLRYSGDELREAPHQSYSVLRAKFDRWMAQRAEEKGAIILPNTRVDDVLRDNGKIAGVIAGGEELGADAVVACDGVLSLIAERAGLRPPGAPRHHALGIKEVIRLDTAVINDRFQVEGMEGAAHLFAGEVTGGRFGGGFLYTNRESISLGLVVRIEDLLRDSRSADVTALLDLFKKRPEIAPLIRGGETLEYSAHVLPEGGFRTMGPFYGDGILVAGDAAGLALNIGFTVRGMDYALASGYWAAQAVLKAKEAGAFDAETLSIYRRLLEGSFVLKDFTNFREAPEVLSNPRFFSHYPEMIGNLLRDVYAVPADTKDKLYATLRKYMTWSEMWAIGRDLKRVRKI